VRLVASLLLVVAGCSSSSSKSGPIDASTGGDAADASPHIADGGCDSPSDASIHYAVLKLDNSLCLPVALPCGCRILFGGVTGGCGQPGLSPASSTDTTTLEGIAAEYDASLPESGLCVLGELPASSTVGAGCADESTSGWCYVQGSCPSDAAAHCTQAVCTTYGFQAAYDTAWLDCP